MRMFDITITTLKMGRACASCKQTFEFSIEAETSEEAIDSAKSMIKVDRELYKLRLDRIKEVK